MSLVIYFINEIYFKKQQQENLFPKAVFQNSPDCVAVENRFFPHFVVCTCSFYFPRGNTCNQLMNCCLWTQLSLGPRSSKSLITRTGMCLQRYHGDANCGHIYYCLCRFFFQNQAQHLELAILSPSR